MATRLRKRGRVTDGRPLPDEAYIEPHVSYARRLAWNIGDLFTRGTAAGIAAGFVFLLANMAYATNQGKPSLAPFMDISTIFHGTDKPASMTPTLDMLATGAIVHISLSIAFGIVFALLVGALAPLLRNWLVLGGAGVLYGLALYVVNFQIFGNTLFQWFTNPKGPDQGFEVFIHAAFGLMLVPFFLGLAHRLRASDARTD
ncbi:MAG: hypothetical protein HOQ28_20525 [Thermoleophilia bacterium]|nr:hypothetical protein [Thermoleophilia bacterium]